MEFIISIIIASLVAVPYRHFKMRYRLISYDNSETCFYGNDEMAEAYEQQNNQNKK